VILITFISHNVQSTLPYTPVLGLYNVYLDVFKTERVAKHVTQTTFG